MKAETFKDIRFIPANISALEEEIAESQRLFGDDRIADQLRKEICRLTEKKKMLREALEAVRREDPEIYRIIDLHYLKGYTWEQATMKMYGYPCPSYCRKKTERFFSDKELTDFL